jgi:hypothetical protein
VLTQGETLPGTGEAHEPDIVLIETKPWFEI